MLPSSAPANCARYRNSAACFGARRLEDSVLDAAYESFVAAREQCGNVAQEWVTQQQEARLRLVS